MINKEDTNCNLISCWENVHVLNVLEVEVVFLDGLEAVESQEEVSLAERTLALWAKRIESYRWGNRHTLLAV